MHAGNNVTFLFTDTRKYLTLLYESAANLLSFKGYTAKAIYETINGQSSKPLTKYLQNA